MNSKSFCGRRIITGIRILLVAALLGISTLSVSAFATEEAEAHGAAAHGAAAHGEEPLNWFDISNKDAPPLSALIFNFAVLVLLVYLMLRKSLSARFKNRQATLETEIKEAREMKDKAEKALKDAKAKIESIDLEMAKLREEILSAGKAESSRVLADAEAQATRLRADATAMVDQQLAQMTHEIRKEIAEEVVGLAERLIRERISAKDRDRFVDEYLNEIAPRTSSIPSEGWDGR